MISDMPDVRGLVLDVNIRCLIKNWMRKGFNLLL